MILAIDFDQVIHDKLNPVPGRRMGPPTEYAQQSLNTLKDKGHTIIVHTVMANTPGGTKAVRDWMVYWKIPFDSIEPKIEADYYIDDKAIKHTDWFTTMGELNG